MWAKSFQSWPILCNPIGWNPPGSSLHGILQARILEWVAMPCFRGSSWPSDQTCISHRSCIAGGFFTTEPPGWANRCPSKSGSGISSSRKASLTTFSSLRWVPSRHQSPVLTSITTLTYVSSCPLCEQVMGKYWSCEPNSGHSSCHTVLLPKMLNALGWIGVYLIKWAWTHLS